MFNQHLADQQRVQLAKLEYQSWQVGDWAFLPGKVPVGRVQKIINTSDGFRATVVRNGLAEVTVLLRGSSGIRQGDPTTWTNEWLRVNLPIGDAIINQSPVIPGELKTASRCLNQLLQSHPQDSFYFYGHSLGSINGQYALANCHFPTQVKGAFLYEGPNIYWLLSQRERTRALHLRCRIFNYIDPKDIVALGYLDYQHTVGLLRVIDSKLVSPISQHMWGGYQFDHQRLRLALTGSPSLRGVIDQRLFEQAQQWADGH